MGKKEKERLDFIKEMMEKLGLDTIEMKDPDTGKIDFIIRGKKHAKGKSDSKRENS